jgi:hypothetical protein
VDDAAVGVAALEPEREPSLVIDVEDDATGDEVAHHRRRLVDQYLHRRGPAEAATGGDRVGGVEIGGVVGFECRRQAALRPVAGALRELGAGDEADAGAELGRPQGTPKSGGAAADHGDVVLRNCGYRPSASRRRASS